MRLNFTNEQINAIVRIGHSIDNDKQLKYNKDFARLFKLEYPDSTASNAQLYQLFTRRRKVKVNLTSVLKMLKYSTRTNILNIKV